MVRACIGPTHTQSLTPQALRLISREMVKLRSDPPEGVRIVVDEEDLSNMEGWVQGPGESPHLSPHTSYTAAGICLPPSLLAL